MRLIDGNTAMNQILIVCSLTTKMAEWMKLFTSEAVHSGLIPRRVKTNDLKIGIYSLLA